MADKSRPDLELIQGEGIKAPVAPPEAPVPEDALFGCTTGGWVWYCDEHDTHGNADSEPEAAFMGMAHSNYKFFTDGESVDLIPAAIETDMEKKCEFIVMQAGEHVAVDD